MPDEAGSAAPPTDEPEGAGPMTQPFGFDPRGGHLAVEPARPELFSTGLYAELRSLHLRFAQDGTHVRDAGDPQEHARVGVAEMLGALFFQLDKYADAVELGVPYAFEVNAGILADHCVILRVGRAAPPGRPSMREMGPAPGNREDEFP